MIAENADIKAIKLAYHADLINSCNGLINEYKNERNNDSYRIELIYDRDHKVSRVKKNGKKSFYCNQKGKKGLGDRSFWQPYHHLDLIHAKGLWILWHEGEKASDYAINIGLISICIVGSGFKCPIIIGNALKAISEAGIAGIIYLADNDETGIKKANYIKKIADKNYPELPFIIVPIKKVFGEAKKGDDFVEFYESLTDAEKAEKGYVKMILEEEINLYLRDLSNSDNQFDNEPDSQYEREGNKSKLTVTSVSNDKTKIKEPWQEKCYNKLYQDKSLISDGDNLYLYNNKNYDLLEKGKVKKQIHHYLNNYLVENENGEFEKPYAKNGYAKKAYDWIVEKVWESSKDINQGGLPLANGILDMEIIDGKAEPKLSPHSPNRLFTFYSEVKYNPNADRKYTDELLQCLDEPYRTLFLESLAVILGITPYRERWDRVKALILVGEGSNGKDTLREVISLLLGKYGITSCNLNHFKQADEGRAFSLARLTVNPKINWASENKALHLDVIQSLKQAITGDPLFIEAKGKEGNDVELQTLFIFNSNEDPSIAGDAKAIQSRFAVIPFTKVYSLNPKAGELQANPRFKHDRQFLVDEVAPVFLNILIEHYQRILEKGINYQSANQYSEEVMEKGNHLKRFCHDVGLGFTGNESDKTPCKEIFQLLHEWYKNEGLLEYTDSTNKEKPIWLDDDDYKFDKIVKVAHQLPKRLKKLFPKAEFKKVKGITWIYGVVIYLNSSISPKPQPEIWETWEVERDNQVFKVKILEVKSRSVSIRWTHNNLEADIEKTELIRKIDG